MLMLLLDAAVICGIGMLLNEGETQGFGTGVASAFAIAIVGFLCLHFVGIIAAVFAIIVASFLVFWAVFSLTPLRAVAGSAIVLVYKIAIAVVVGFLMA